jgi:hypothetical protein
MQEIEERKKGKKEKREKKKKRSLEFFNTCTYYRKVPTNPKLVRLEIGTLPSTLEGRTDGL